MTSAKKGDEEVAFAVFEVGLGGRLDSTNIVQPAVCIITEIDFDHENFLGHSIEQIAGEKAGIIKPGVPVVCSATRPEARTVIERRAAELGAPFAHIDDEAASKEPVQLTVPLPGRFQLRNARAAALAAQVLASRGFGGVTEDAIHRGIAAVRWPGRLECVSAPGVRGAASSAPTVYLDGTHNPAGARELVAFWDEQFPARRIHLVFGAVRDKAVDEIAGLLFPRAECVYITAPRTGRAISPHALAHITAHHARAHEVFAEPEAALQRALAAAAPDEVVFVTGSLYLVGDLRRWWRQRASNQPFGAYASS